MITEHSCTSKICSLCTGQLLIISWRSSPHRLHPLVHCPAAHLEPKDSKNIRNVSDQISDMKQQQICAKGNSLRFLYCGNLLFYPARSWTTSDDRSTKQVWRRVKFWCSIWHMKQHSYPQNPQDNLRDLYLIWDFLIFIAGRIITVVLFYLFSFWPSHNSAGQRHWIKIMECGKGPRPKSYSIMLNRSVTLNSSTIY